MSDDAGRDFLRHTLATLSYRAAKPLRGAPHAFVDFRVAPESRSAGQILSHMCDLIDWALALAEADGRWRDAPATTWSEDCDRFFGALENFDRCLASNASLRSSAADLFQGPVADALTHTGQLTMMRRLAGAPIRGEDYAKAEISAGRVGRSHAAPRAEFD